MHCTCQRSSNCWCSRCCRKRLRSRCSSTSRRSWYNCICNDITKLHWKQNYIGNSTCNSRCNSSCNSGCNSSCTNSLKSSGCSTTAQQLVVKQRLKEQNVKVIHLDREKQYTMPVGTTQIVGQTIAISCYHEH